MHFIKKCPACGKKLRFPIDKGKIKVKCSCGYSFLADPDDTDIYKDGNFDLEGGKKSKMAFFPGKLMNSLRLDRFTLSNLINTLFEVKYKLQNFRLLPTSEQKKILIIIMVLVFLIMLVVFLIHGTVSNGGNVI